MAVFTGQTADIYLASGSMALTHEAMTDSGDHTNYQVTNAAKRVLDYATTQQISTSTDGVTWTVQAASLYTLNGLTGTVTFNSAQSSSTLARIESGAYLPIAVIAQATDWTLSISADMKDVSVLGSDWKKQIYAMRSATVQFNKWWEDSFYLGLLTAGSIFVIKLDADNVNNRSYMCYAQIQNDSIKTVNDSPVSEAINCTVLGKPIYIKATGDM